MLDTVEGPVEHASHTMRRQEGMSGSPSTFGSMEEVEQSLGQKGLRESARLHWIVARRLDVKAKSEVATMKHEMLIVAVAGLLVGALGGCGGGGGGGPPPAAPGVIEFTLTSYSYQEDSTPIVAMTVRRTGGTDGAVSATVTAADGTANSDAASVAEPVDYAQAPTVVAFADQDGADKIIDVAIVQDSLPEISETFGVTLALPTGGAALGAVAAATVTIIDDDPMLTLDSPVQANGVRFGASLASLGARLGIGSPGASSNLGRVDIFDMATRASVATLATQAGPGAQWGSTLGTDGVNILIGINQGNQAAWIYDAYTLAIRFGFCCAGGLGKSFQAIDGNRIVIGAPFVLGNPQAPRGEIYVYSDLTGLNLQMIPGQDGTGEMFGTSLAVLGSDLLVGAPEGDGVVRKFSGDPLAVSLIINDPFPDPQPVSNQDKMGTAVASISGKILASAPREDMSGPNTGVVYVFDGISGALLDAILPPVALPSGGFGDHMIVIGNRICVQQTSGGVMGAGVIFVFDELSNLVQTIDDPWPTPGATFGAAMADLDGALVVGAPLEDVGGMTDVGGVYVFRLN